MHRSSVITLRINPETTRRLDEVAKSTKRRRSLVAADALNSYLDINDWHINEISEGLEEADRGDFADDAEVERVTKKWSKRAH